MQYGAAPIGCGTGLRVGKDSFTPSDNRSLSRVSISTTTPNATLLAHLQSSPPLMSNFSLFSDDEKHLMDQCIDEARELRNKAGTTVLTGTEYKVSLQQEFRLRVARALFDQSPETYKTFNDPKCFYRLVSLDYVSTQIVLNNYTCAE